MVLKCFQVTLRERFIRFCRALSRRLQVLLLLLLASFPAVELLVLSLIVMRYILGGER